MAWFKKEIKEQKEIKEIKENTYKEELKLEQAKQHNLKIIQTIQQAKSEAQAKARHLHPKMAMIGRVAKRMGSDIGGALVHAGKGIAQPQRQVTKGYQLQKAPQQAPFIQDIFTHQQATRKAIQPKARTIYVKKGKHYIRKRIKVKSHKQQRQPQQPARWTPRTNFDFSKDKF